MFHKGVKYKDNLVYMSGEKSMHVYDMERENMIMIDEKWNLIYWLERQKFRKFFINFGIYLGVNFET